ncbi:DUF4340 domain-containing protein [bacterium]|nr:DUF4340 domain-containing protein [bacterium]
MIKTKNLVILGIVLVVLLGVNLAQRSGHRQETSRSSVVELLPAGVTAEQLTRITLGQGDDDEAVVLEKDPEGWVVASAWGAAANPERVEGLVRNLQGLTGEFRSDSAAVLPDYLLDERAVRVRCLDAAGATVLALDVGGKPERFPGNFVRRPGSDAVYVSQKNVLSQLGIYGEPEKPGNRYFLELQAVQLDRNDVDRLVVTGSDFAWDLSKEFAVVPPAADAPDSVQAAPEVDRLTWEWRATAGDGPALAKTKVDAVLNSLAVIRATDLVDPAADPATYGLDAPGRRAELHLQDGTTVTLRFGADREAVEGAPAGTFMQREGDPTVWVVTEYAMANIFKPLAELQAE